MKTYSIFDKTTGQFTGQRFSTDRGAHGSSDHDIARHTAALRANTPDGCALIEGAYDHTNQCVDLVTGKVIDYQPGAPDGDHEWNATTKRWELKPEVQAKQQARKLALGQIDTLERAQQRAVREMALDATNPQARARLQELDARIAVLRTNLQD